MSDLPPDCHRGFLLVSTRQRQSDSTFSFAAPYSLQSSCVSRHRQRLGGCPRPHGRAQPGGAREASRVLEARASRGVPGLPGRVPTVKTRFCAGRVISFRMIGDTLVEWRHAHYQRHRSLRETPGGRGARAEPSCQAPAEVDGLLPDPWPECGPDLPGPSASAGRPALGGGAGTIPPPWPAWRRAHTGRTAGASRPGPPTWPEPCATWGSGSPRWGKDKLGVVLRARGGRVSTSMVGRILSHLRIRGLLQDPPRNGISARKRLRPWPYAVRKPPDYRVREPGDLVQVDTLDVRPRPGLAFKQFTARDVVSRWDVGRCTRTPRPAPRRASWRPSSSGCPSPSRLSRWMGGASLRPPVTRPASSEACASSCCPPPVPQAQWLRGAGPGHAYGRVLRSHRLCPGAGHLQPGAPGLGAHLQHGPPAPRPGVSHPPAVSPPASRPAQAGGVSLIYWTSTYD